MRYDDGLGFAISARTGDHRLSLMVAWVKKAIFER
jgi:hypothetical protein